MFVNYSQLPFHFVSISRLWINSPYQLIDFHSSFDLFISIYCGMLTPSVDEHSIPNEDFRCLRWVVFVPLFGAKQWRISGASAVQADAAAHCSFSSALSAFANTNFSVKSFQYEVLLFLNLLIITKFKVSVGSCSFIVDFMPAISVRHVAALETFRSFHRSLQPRASPEWTIQVVVLSQILFALPANMPFLQAAICSNSAFPSDVSSAAMSERGKRSEKGC